MRKRITAAIGLCVSLLVSACLVLAACGGGSKVTITVNSELNPTISVNEVYTLDYTVSDESEATVTASGGAYSAESKTFSASTAGNYTLTITAGTGKKVATATVNITVTALDLTALNAAIASAEALVSTDYTPASWNKLNTALTAAKSISAASMQSDVALALTNLNTAVTGLSARSVTRAVVSDTAISYGGTTYNADDYQNFDEIKLEIESMEDIKLNSAYKAAFDEIIANLSLKFKMTVEGARGIVLTSALQALEFKASANMEGATITASIGGVTIPGENGVYVVTPASFDTQNSITFKAELEGYTAVTETVTFSMHRYNLIANPNMQDKISVTNNNVVKTLASTGWGDNEGKKAYINNLEVTGDFEASFDVKYLGNYGTDVAVVTLHSLSANATGNQHNAWGCACFGGPNAGRTEVALGGSEAEKFRTPCDGLTAEAGRTYSFVYSRTITGTSAVYDFYMVGENGEKLGSNPQTGSIVGPLFLGFNIEEVDCEVSNLVISCDGIIDKDALLAKITEAAAYNDDEIYVLDNFTPAYNAAVTMSNKLNATQAEIDAATAALNTAIENIERIPVIKATINGDSTVITFGETEYAKTLYDSEAFETAVAAVNELNADTSVDDNNKYTAAFNAIIATLQQAKRLTVSIEGASGVLSVATLSEVSYAVSVNDPSATVTAKLNGEDIAITNGTVKFTPEYKAYKLEVHAQLADGTKDDKVLNVMFADAAMTINPERVDQLEIVDGVIKTKASMDWGSNQECNKIYIGGYDVIGNFTYSATVKFVGTYTNLNEANVFTLHAAQSDGANNPKVLFYGAACYTGGNAGKIETFTDKDKRVALPENAMAEGSVITYTLSRTIANGKATWTFTASSTDGTVLATKTVDNDSVAAARLSMNFEHLNCEITNVSFTAQNATDKRALISAYNAGDFTLDREANVGVDEYYTELFAAQMAIVNIGISQATVDEIVANIATTKAAVATRTIFGITDGAQYMTAKTLTLPLEVVPVGEETYTWFVNNEQVATGTEYEFVKGPGTYAIKLVSGNGAETEYNIEVVDFDYKLIDKRLETEGKISLTEDTITVKNFTGWDGYDNQKVELGLVLDGAFEMTFDVKFVEDGGNTGSWNVLAIWMANADPTKSVDARRADQSFIGLRYNKGEGNYPQMVLNDRDSIGAKNFLQVDPLVRTVDKVLTYKIVRYCAGGASFYSLYITDGATLVGKIENKRMGSDRAVMPVFNFENLKCVVNNFTVKMERGGEAYPTTVLRNLVLAADKINQNLYTAESMAVVDRALADAKVALYDSVSNKAAKEAAYTALDNAIKALVLGDALEYTFAAAESHAYTFKTGVAVPRALTTTLPDGATIAWSVGEEVQSATGATFTYAGTLGTTVKAVITGSDGAVISTNTFKFVAPAFYAPDAFRYTIDAEANVEVSSPFGNEWNDAERKKIRDDAAIAGNFTVSVDVRLTAPLNQDIFAFMFCKSYGNEAEELERMVLMFRDNGIKFDKVGNDSRKGFNTVVGDKVRVTVTRTIKGADSELEFTVLNLRTNETQTITTVCAGYNGTLLVAYQFENFSGWVTNYSLVAMA